MRQDVDTTQERVEHPRDRQKLAYYFLDSSLMIHVRIQYTDAAVFGGIRSHVSSLHESSGFRFEAGFIQGK